MRLAPGSRLGPYEIVALLGAGGMGEVYRAHDRRLKRDVAIKVLRPELARHASGESRFEHEARAAAALNHPNIVAVFDVGVGDVGPYVVSELLDGETLRGALLRGPLPPATALDLAIQTARGMAAAHQRGIVHRDLKPENIFITTDGRAKILDFGLAKLTEAAAASEEGGPTSATATTMPGTVMGTAGYMAPEQVRGGPADARSDIFAFGAVFYEMLTGRRAFAGDSAIETLAAILQLEPPDFSSGGAPPVLDRIIRRCLHKNPALRFQSAGDIAFALEAVQATTPSSSTGPLLSPALEHPSPPSSSSAPLTPIPLAGTGTTGLTVAPSRAKRLAVVATLLAAGVAIGVVGSLVARPAPARPARVTFQPKTFDRLPITNARFMPDGQTIVYSAAVHGMVPSLFVINPNVEAPQPLGVADAHLLSISSRGELALVVNARHLEQRLYAGTLARMTVGSSPRPMLEDVREADWSPDGGSLAIVHDLGDGRDRLEYPVGTALHEVSGYLSDPRVSPDGNRVAFFEHQWRFDDRGWVKVVDRARKVTTLGGEFWGLQGLAWSSDGSKVVFSGSASGGSILQPIAVAADGTGTADPLFGVPGRFIVNDVSRDGRWLAVREDLSLGVRARVPGELKERELSWLGSSGARAMSRDGRWLLMVDVGSGGGKDYGVVLRRTDLSQTIRLGEGNAQRLSPDGRWAVALLSTPSQLVLYPTGPGDRLRLPAGPITSYVSVEFFPDGRRLLVCGAAGSRAPRCYEQDVAGAEPKPLTPEGVLASIAPDGNTLLLSMQDGSMQLSSIAGGVTRPVTGLGPADRRIAWSSDSRSIYVHRGLDVPAIVERVNLVTGARTAAAQLAPDDVPGVVLMYVMDWVDDGRGYVYNYTSLPSTLFVVSGARP